MKKLIRVATAAALIGGLTWSTSAKAACTNLANTADPACKAAQACQNEIVKRATAYVAAVQKAHTSALAKSLTGKQTKKPAAACIGGPNNAKPCLHNNGVCKSAANKAKYCNVDGDCDGVPGSCDRTKGCNPAGPGSNDVNECQVDTSKADYAKDVQKARTTFRSAVIKKCNTAPAVVPVSDIGMDNNPLCPNVGAALTASAAYDALVDCVTESQAGDFNTGLSVDINHRVFEKIMGSSTTAAPQQAPGKESTNPYMLLEFQGSQVLQVGTVASDNLSAGGGITPLSMASCSVAAGGTGSGNGNTGCTTDADCGTDSMSVAGNCKLNGLNPANCPSGSANCRTITGPGPVKADGINGNTLTVSETCASGTATCLITKTKNSGNGTAAKGGWDGATGELATFSPIATDIYITGMGTCSMLQDCPHCSGGTCDSGTNIGQACTAEGPTIQCPPSGFPAAAATVPNPLTLSTEPKNLTANGGGKFCGHCDNVATQDGVCTGGTATCANGCGFSYPGGADQECIDKLGAGHFCDFGSAGVGFHGDTSLTSIDADGTRSQYTPVTTGLFCTGQTSVGLINTAAGLPGPVRVNLPQTNVYVHTTN